jgi:hypothetical protein
VRKATISFLLAVVASVLSLTVSLYSGKARLQHPGEPSTYPVRHETLISVNGPLVCYILAMPVIIAGVPILLRFRAARIFSAILLLGVVVIGAASIGLFYLPSAITMVMAASEKPTR